MDTSQIPAAAYDALVRVVNRFRLLVLGPRSQPGRHGAPSILVGVRYAFVLFGLAMEGLLAVPQLRRRSGAQIRNSTKRWQLRAE